MTIRPIDTQQDWDDFVQAQEHGSFLQSWHWGQFEKTLGHAVHYWGLYEQERLIGTSLLIQVRSKRGRYLECLGGPVFASFTREHFDAWMQEVTTFAQDNGADFLRLRLPLPHTKEGLNYLSSYKAQEAPLYYQAELTRRVSLADDVDALFAQMKKKTRYEIRRSVREGVEVEKVYSSESSTDEWERAFEIFWKLYQAMVKRQGYVGYSRSYLHRQFELFFAIGQAYMYLAKHNDEYVAATIFFDYGSTTTYHHSASLPQSAMSAPAVLIWEAMQEAKARGRVWFDLFGIAPSGRRYASRLGLTYFKEGFGGEEFQWLRTHDVVFNPIGYQISRLIEQIPGRWRQWGSSIIKI